MTSWLDTNTVLTVAGLIYLVLPIVTWLAVYSMRQPSTVAWCVGSMLTGIGFILIGLRDQLPIWLSLIVGQSVLVYSFLLRTRALQTEMPHIRVISHLNLIAITAFHSLAMSLFLWLESVYWLSVWNRGLNTVIAAYLISQIFLLANESGSRNAVYMGWAYVLPFLAALYNTLLSAMGQSNVFENHLSTGTLVAGIAGLLSALLGHIFYVGMVYERSLSAIAQEQARRERIGKDNDMFKTLTDLDRQMRLGALTASLSHAISQPLAGMLIHLRQSQKWLMASPPQPTQALQSLERVMAENDRAAHTIDHIRQFLKPVTAQPELFNPSELVFNLQRLMKHEFINTSTQIEWPQLNPRRLIYGDKAQLTHACLHIFQQILQKMTTDEPHTIVVEWEEEPETVHMTLIHKGASLTDNELKIPRMICERFECHINTKTEPVSLTCIALYSPPPTT